MFHKGAINHVSTFDDTIIVIHTNDNYKKNNISGNHKSQGCRAQDFCRSTQKREH